MKKLAKILIFLIIIGIFVNITLSRYVEENSNISGKIGSIWTGAPISTYNYAAIMRNFEYYKSFLEKEDYLNAYKFLPYEYKLYKSYDTFVEEAKKINFSELQIINIIRRTENMYSIVLSHDNKEIENLIIFNEENTSFTITPESFLEYKEYDQKIKKKNVRYELISTINCIDKFVANINITNLSKTDIVKISNIELIQNNVKHISRKHFRINNKSRRNQKYYSKI